MAGKRQRFPDQLADRRAQRARPLTVLTETVVSPPQPPADIDGEAVRVWTEFWTSPVARTVTLSAHREALEHWIRCVSQRYRLWEAWTKQPLIRGSHDQLVTNPLYRQIKSLNEEIHRAEEQFGMTPLAQLRLGVTFLQERSLAASLKVPRDCAAEDDATPEGCATNDVFILEGEQERYGDKSAWQGVRR